MRPSPGWRGPTFNVSIDQSVFVYKYIDIDRPGDDNDEVNVRGLNGFDEGSLVTCVYDTPSGNHVIAVGFFTPRR